MLKLRLVGEASAEPTGDLQTLAKGAAGALQIAEIALDPADVVERDRQIAQRLRRVADRLAQLAAKLKALAIGAAGGLQIAEVTLDPTNVVQRDRQIARACGVSPTASRRRRAISRLSR